VELIEHEPAPVFWPIFTELWTECDEVFPWTERLTAALRQVGPCPDLAVGTSALTVYRGAARDRVDGLSWTTDRTSPRNSPLATVALR
jgi:hypothetical protein